MKQYLPPFLQNPNPDIYLEGDFVLVDLETTNIDKGLAINPKNRIIFTGWYTSWDNTYHKLWGGEYDLDPLFRDLDRADFVVGQNLKFEYMWLTRAGYPVHELLGYCTMLGHWVLAGNRSWKLDLDSLVKYYKVGSTKVDVGKVYMNNGICPSTWPRYWLEKYGMADVRNELAVFKAQRAVLRDNNLLPVQYNRCILTPLLAAQELLGGHLDKEVVLKVHNDSLDEMLKCKGKLDEITGGINTSSNVQKALFLYEELGFPIPKGRFDRPCVGKFNKKYPQFPDGFPKTDSPTIALLKPNTKKQKEFIKWNAAYQKIRKRVTTYTENFFKSVTKYHGFVYAQFNQGFTATHRLSSSGRNVETEEYSCSTQLQNIERELKPCFNSRYPGWKIIDPDFAALEFKGATILSKDPKAIEDTNNKVDVHEQSAKIIKKKEIQKAGRITEEIRTSAKEFTFGPAFGKEEGSTKEETEYFQWFRERYAGITAMQNKMIASAIQDKKVVTPWGLVYYFPYAKPNSKGKIADRFKICNYAIQGFSTAEVSPAASVMAWHVMKRMNLRANIWSQVHDSAPSEAHPDDVDQVCQVFKWAFEEGVEEYIGKLYGIDFCVPLVADISVTNNWGNKFCKECKEEYNPLIGKHECKEEK